MLYDNSNLLDHINSAIISKWYKNGTEDGKLSGTARQEGDHTGLINKKKFTDSKNGEFIEKLEEKIEILHNQYDQMLYFINFLVDNLPTLVLNIVHANQETNEIFTETVETGKTITRGFKGKPVPVNDEPQPTRREKDVLDLLIKGLCAKEIASSLYISESTVITHKKNLKEKFNAKNTAELIAKAHSNPSLHRGSH